MLQRRSPVLNEEVERPRTRSRAKLEVKRARNAQNSISISLLPPEILLLVFFAVKEARSGKRGTGSLGNMDWVRVTHVCHHWRVVALTAPTLWTTLSITLSSPRLDWVNLAIQRSKHALLSVCVEFLTPWYKEGCVYTSTTILELANELLRYRSLTLRIIDDSNLPSDLFRHHHAPNLHSLTISSNDYVPSRFKLSDKTLSAPSLQRLELNNCRVDWHSTLFQSITYLKVDLMLQDRLCLPEFISVLSSMSSLQELHTDMTPFYLVAPNEPVDPPMIQTFPKKLILTNIDKISLVAPLAGTLAFFSSFRSRPNAHISARAAFRSHHSFEQLNHLLEALAYHFPSTANCTGSPADTESLPLRSLRICHQNSGFSIQALHSTLHLWDLASVSVENLLLGALNILISSDHSTYRPFEPQLMRSIFNALPFDDLVSVNVAGGFTFDKTVWAETFGRIARLQTILLNSENIVEFFDSLVYGLEEANSEASLPADQKIRVPFPSLDTVLVLSMAEMKDSIVEFMETILRQREEIGKPISTVVLILPASERASSGKDALVTLRSTIAEEELRTNMVTAMKTFIHNTAE